MTYKTLSDIKRANANAGNYWFDRGSMRFFNTSLPSSSVYPAPDGGAYFVTSECMEPGRTPRRFTVRLCDSDGDVETVGDFMAYRTAEDAFSAIIDISKES